MLKFRYIRKCTRKKFVDNLFTQVLAWGVKKFVRLSHCLRVLPPHPTLKPQDRFEAVAICIGRLR